MDSETQAKVRAMIADAKARFVSLEADIIQANAAGINTTDMEYSLNQAKEQIAQVERVYGAY